MHHLSCSSYRNTSPVHIVSVTCNFFFYLCDLWHTPPPPFFLFCTLVFSMSVSDSHNCCQYVLPILLPVYLRSRESSSMFFLCFLITYYLSICLYWLPSALGRTCNNEIKCRTNQVFVLEDKAVQICCSRWVYFLSLLNSGPTTHLFSHFSLSSNFFYW